MCNAEGRASALCLKQHWPFGPRLISINTLAEMRVDPGHAASTHPMWPLCWALVWFSHCNVYYLDIKSLVLQQNIPTGMKVNTLIITKNKAFKTHTHTHKTKLNRAKDHAFEKKAMHFMRKALCCVRQEGLMLSRPSQKLILWDLCQLSRQIPANSLCQRLGMLGKLSEVCLGFFFFFWGKYATGHEAVG